MKQLISLFMVFAFIGCDGVEDKTSFKSLEGNSDFQDSIASIVDADVEKIGRRKNKKGEKVTLDVGGKDLNEPTTTLEVAVYDDISTTEEPAVEEPAAPEKADILFYVGGQTNNCLKDLAEEVAENGFLTHLDAKVDWNVAISLFPKRPALTDVENTRGIGKYTHFKNKLFFHHLFLKPVSVFKKSELKVKKAEKLFLETIQDDKVEYNRDHYNDNRYDATRDHKIKNTLPVKDFINGLDALLTSAKGAKFLREGSKLHVVVIDYEHFPYYTTKEWKDFYKKYPTLNIILLSSRRVSVSNFMHISESSKFNFEWLPKCNRDGISQELIQSILN